MEGSQAPSFGVDRALGFTVLVLVLVIGVVLAFEWVLVLGRGSDLISVSLTRGAGGGDILVKWLNTLSRQARSFTLVDERTRPIVSASPSLGR